MIKVSHLTKTYGNIRAVNDISFTIAPGEIVGLLGPNGAGKSTTMNMLTGYISSTSGSIEIQGKNIVENPMEAKKRIGYLPEIPPLYLDMTLDEYLDFVYDLKGVTLPRKKHLAQVKKLTNLSHMGARLLRNFSKGYRQRAGLAQALVGDPPVLILDEPTIGLDPEQIIEFRNLISGLGKTTIISTHILSEASTLCTRMLIISGGKLIAEGSRDDMAGIHDFRYTLEAETTLSALSDILSNVDGISDIQVTEEGETSTVFSIQCTSDVRAMIFKAMAEANLPILTLKKSTPSLEEVFLQAVSHRGEEKE